MTTATDGLELAQSFGLNKHEYDLIVSLIGREPNLTELGMYSVMWSEHCGYKYSRPILAYFAKYKAALESGGMENAGVIPITKDLGVVFKIESHNHPSAVEPYQGAATGVGGILRDIFTMGARPIASLNSLRFGPLSADSTTSEATAQRNRYLLEHVVAGIAGYGNCVGVPTVGGEINFHSRYSGNPLVNAMAIGLMNLNEITTAAAQGIGNPVIYLGSSTGRDGIHGASFASTGLDEDSADKRPNVQIGDPFAEKLLIEATLESLQTGAVVAIQDMGAAGLTCSTIEMAAKGRVGMQVDLDKVPMRESDMSAYELMLSESQERMLCVAERDREHEVIDVFTKWGIHAVVIGEVIADEVVRVRRHGVVEAELYPPYLADKCPTYTVVPEVPEYYERAKHFRIEDVADCDPQTALKALLSSPNIASKRWIYRQYDQQVQTQTVVRPGAADAAVLVPHGAPVGIAVKTDGNALQTYLDPYIGGQLAVVESARNVACTGAMPKGATDGLNFGNPQYPQVYWQFDRCVKGIAEAAEIMQTPVVSGNVSFYNESELGEILPTPIIGMVGVIEDVSNTLTKQLPRNVKLVALCVPEVNATNGGLGASQYLSVVGGIEDGLPASPNVAGERRLCELLVELAAKKLVVCAADSSEGGVAITLCEMAFAGNCGLQANLDGLLQSKIRRKDAVLFGEVPGQVIVGVTSEQFQSVREHAVKHEIGCLEIGTSGGEDIVLEAFDQELIRISTKELLDFHSNSIENLLLASKMSS